MPTARHAHAYCLIALLVLTALAFMPGLSGGFIFDDFPNIVQQPKVHADGVDAESLRTAAAAYEGLLSRPLATMSFAFNHAQAGLDPFPYKLTNLLVHVLNALLVFQLVRRLLVANGRVEPHQLAPAFAVAALWAIHPLQVSTVSYVVQRMEMMSLTFVLVALLAYLRGRQLQISGLRAWPWLAACLPLVYLGLLCKETALLFPAYALALELTLLAFGARRPGVSRGWRVAYAAGTLATLLLLVFVAYPHYAQEGIYALRDFSMGERLLTQLRVLPMYLGWILLPLPANYVFYYDNFPISQGFLDPMTTLFGGLFLVGLLVLAIGLRRRMPLASLGVLWFFAAHFLTSNVANLELVFEHRNYFALLGVLLVVADLILRMPTSELPRIRTFTVGIVIAGALVLTLIRSATWGNPLMLAMELTAKNAGSVRASTDLGEQYMLRAQKDPASRFHALAEAEFERGAGLPGATAIPEQGLIMLTARAGLPVKPEWWDRLVEKLETRIIGPQEVGMLSELLRMRQAGVQFDDRRFADAYLALSSRMLLPAGKYFEFGEHALTFLGDHALASQLFRRAVDESRGSPEFVAAMVANLNSQGDVGQALALADYARQAGIATIEFNQPPAAEAKTD